MSRRILGELELELIAAEVRVGHCRGCQWFKAPSVLPIMKSGTGM